MDSWKHRSADDGFTVSDVAWNYQESENNIESEEKNIKHMSQILLLIDSKNMYVFVFSYVEYDTPLLTLIH